MIVENLPGCEHVLYKEWTMDQTNWKKLYPVDPILIPSLKAGALSGKSRSEYL